MLIIKTNETEFWNDVENKFVYIKPQTLRLEFSLISISKWEAKWHIPFFYDDPSNPKSDEQMNDLIICMSIDPIKDPNIVYGISAVDMQRITDYIEDPMTATKINNIRHTGKKEVLTSELIYYYMIQCGIPFECEKWHINRLFMLMAVCASKSEKPKRMSRRAVFNQNAAINAARRAKYHSKG